MMMMTAWMILVALMDGRFLQAMVIGIVPLTALWLFAKLDARRLAVRAPADYALKEYNRWYVYAMLVGLIFAIAVCGAFFIRERAYEAFIGVSDCMSPTIAKGERVIANKTIYRVQPMRRGDVVIVVATGARRYSTAQRLAALPGDTVEVRGGVLLVNGEPVSRPPFMPPPKAPPATLPASGPADDKSTLDVPAHKLPPGTGYFINDNPQTGEPNEVWPDLGQAPLTNVVGRIEFVYWPWPRAVK